MTNFSSKYLNKFDPGCLNNSVCTDVRVVYFCIEYNFGGDHWVIVRKQNFCLEFSSAVAGSLGTVDDDEEMFKIVRVGRAIYAGDWIRLQCFSLFGYSRTWSFHPAISANIYLYEIQMSNNFIKKEIFETVLMGSSVN